MGRSTRKTCLETALLAFVCGLVLVGGASCKEPAWEPDLGPGPLGDEMAVSMEDQRVLDLSVVDLVRDQRGEEDQRVLDLGMTSDLRPSCNADMTQSDPNNCGVCGRVCPAGNLCCSGSCRDPQTDSDNCLLCGHSCGGNSCCSGLCTSLSTPSNCGACGRSCAAGESCCNGSCTDYQSDSLNCGGCNNPCSAGKICVRGACYAADGGVPDMSGPGCLGGKTPPAACFLDKDPMSGAPYTICKADCMSAWVHHADPAGGTFAFQTICRNLGYSRAAQWGGTCGDICGYCEGKVTSCMKTGSEKYDNGGVCGADCLSVTVMWQCVR